MNEGTHLYKLEVLAVML